MPVARMTFQQTVAGIISGSGSRTVTGDSAEIAAPQSVLAAQGATLTTRTDDNTGTLTMTSGSHGIITGQRIDLYWPAGTRYGVIAGTVVGTSVPFDLGAGNNLPIATTAIKVGIPVEHDFSVIGDDVIAFAAAGENSTRSYFVFIDAIAAELPFLVAAGGVTVFDGTGANPLAGFDPESVWISHEDTTAAHANMVAGILR